MATINSANIDEQGVVYYDGAGSFSGLDGGTAGNVLVSNGTGLAPDFATTAVGGDGLVLISSTTANNTASIIYTGLTNYSMYVLDWTNVVPVSNAAKLTMTVSDDNGSTYFSTGYQSGLVGRSMVGLASLFDNATTSILLTGNSSTSGGSSGSVLIGPFNSSNSTSVSGKSLYTSSFIGGLNVSGWLGASTGSNTGIDAIKLIFTTGNISTGTFNLYGLAT